MTTLIMTMRTMNMSTKMQYKQVMNFKRMTKLTKLGSVTAISFLTACGGSREQQAPVFNQLNELVDSQYVCTNQLLLVGNKLIKDKAHSLQREQVMRFDEEGMADVSVDSNNRLMLSGLIEYNDRPAHVRFDTYPTTSNDGSESGECIVSYQLDYQLDIPCIAAREEAFKKWNQIGELGDSTRYFVHMRKPNKKAFLTSINRNQQCLVSVKETQVVLNK